MEKTAKLCIHQTSGTQLLAHGPNPAHGALPSGLVQKFGSREAVASLTAMALPLIAHRIQPEDWPCATHMPQPVPLICHSPVHG